MLTSTPFSHPVKVVTKAGREIVTLHSWDALRAWLGSITADHPHGHTLETNEDWPGCIHCGIIDPTAPRPAGFNCSCSTLEHAKRLLEYEPHVEGWPESDMHKGIHRAATYLGLDTDIQAELKVQVHLENGNLLSGLKLKLAASQLLSQAMLAIELPGGRIIVISGGPVEDTPTDSNDSSLDDLILFFGGDGPELDD